MKLRPRQICPLHGRKTCCDRESEPRRKHPRYTYIEPGVRRTRDGRQLRSPAAKRRLVDQKIREQNKLCPICMKPFKVYGEIVLAHVRCRGMGGAFTDDSPGNTIAAHSLCNGEMGSRDLTDMVVVFRSIR